MLAFWETAWWAERRILRVATAWEFRPIFALVFATLLVGSIFYRVVEGWHLFDAFYFSVVTLATIGYGDFSPETTLRQGLHHRLSLRRGLDLGRVHQHDRQAVGDHRGQRRSSD